MLVMLGATPDTAPRGNKLMTLWTDDGSSETLHESWKTSRLFGALERMLSNPDASSPQIQDKRQRDEHDDTADLKEFRLVRSSTPLGPEAPRVVEPYAYPTSKRARQSPHDIPGITQPLKRLDALHLPPETSQLLDVYFAVTHTWFPIVAKHSILRASYLYANVPFSISNAGKEAGDHAALWAILSYTISQSKGGPRDGRTSLAKAKEFYTISRKLIPSENESYQLGHIQALLLLTSVNIGLEDWTAAWLLSGQAVRMAIAMGLDTYSNNQRSDEIKQGRTVFLGCFVIDSLLSFRLGRTPCMSSHDLTTVGRLEEDGLEEWNSWVDVLPPMRGSQSRNPPQRGPLLSLSSFNRLVDLAAVLNKISRGSSEASTMYVSARQIVLELKQWDDCLPLGCRLIGPESIYPERHSALLPHQTYLGLTYVATLLCLYLRMVPKESTLHPSQRPATEGAKKLLFRALPMMSQHLENFQTCGLPPVFEITLGTIAKQALTLRDTIMQNTFPFTQWTEGFLHRIVELKSPWPVYDSLVSAIEQRSRSNNANPTSPMGSQGPVQDLLNIARGSSSSFGEAPIEMPEGGSQGRQSGISQRDRGSLHDNESPMYSNLGISIPVDGHPMAQNDTVMGNADFSMMENSLRQSTDKSSSFLDKLAQSNGPDLMLSPTLSQRPASTLISDIPSASTARSDRHMSSGNDLIINNESPNFQEPVDLPSDLDSIFNDLAYLDTTEWATSREAGLKDFGFMDDSTFQAFCHDPDRLEGSQPLVHPSSIADIWPPPGFFPEAFQDNTNDATHG